MNVNSPVLPGKFEKETESAVIVMVEKTVAVDSADVTMTVTVGATCVIVIAKVTVEVIVDAG